MDRNFKRRLMKQTLWISLYPKVTNEMDDNTNRFCTSNKGTCDVSLSRPLTAYGERRKKFRYDVMLNARGQKSTDHKRLLVLPARYKNLHLDISLL